MSHANSTLRIRQISGVAQEVEAFLVDRQARGLAAGSLRFYTQKLAHLRDYCRAQGITEVEDLTAPLLRRFLLDFSRDHNPGGTHGVFRAVKAFLRWYEAEVEPEDWRNPIAKVRPPKVPVDPLEPVELDAVRKMLGVCADRRSVTDLRDKAILLALLDTGCRASELVALQVGDVNMHTGAVMVRRGKGGKTRTVFLGAKARRVLGRYLRVRGEYADGDALFASMTTGDHLRYESLRDIVRRRAAQAGVEAPTLHSFRRAFAL
ncbi:MAG: tyrosine-type recombinase/integrase, partial [Chloroflexi bacterium]|nr:tyrosine-type recombinase/integrase [Chloroflexota bacterium]